MAGQSLNLGLIVAGGLVALGAAFVALRGDSAAVTWASVKQTALGILHQGQQRGTRRVFRHPRLKASAEAACTALHSRLQRARTAADAQAKEPMAAVPACPVQGPDDPRRIVVVGGGLAGCTAALSAHAVLSQANSGSKVEIVLVERMPKLGGNSAKASSGINALNVAGGDSTELFETDTIQSGGGRSKPDLVATLVAQSPDAISFLESFSVDLSKVTLLGGHAKPRTRTNPVGGNVGWSIMSKVITVVKQTTGIRTLENHKLERLLLDPKTGSVCGVVVSSGDNTTILPAAAVILATGGFAANRALLARHSPQAAELATTNGPWAQGDALAVAEAVGANMRDLDQVQIHPTGFVDPSDPSSGTKFLAPEKLRGVGGILLNRAGQRFVDELGRRDHVSSAITQQSGHEAYLVLSEEAAQDYGVSAIQFYVAKKLMSKVEGVSGLASLISEDTSDDSTQPTDTLQATLVTQLESYNAAREAGHTDPWGKTVFPKGFPPDGVMYVGRITPVVHYTMGGVEIDTQARVLTATGQPIPGLYAAGEVSGGVHGKNRLGGNSLLECTVFGRIAGEQAARLVTAEERTATA